MAKQKVRADMIKAALAIRHKEDSFFTEVRNGPAVANELLILDAVAFKRSWANPCITGYEIKVSRSDFLADEKWRGYLMYCNQWFVWRPGVKGQKINVIWGEETGERQKRLSKSN